VDFSSAESEIRNLQDAIRESVSSIPQPESLNLSPLTQKLADIVSSIDRMEPADLMNVESLLSQILLALKREPEETDYTPHLEAIQEALQSLQTKEKEDYEPFLVELEKILKKNLNINVTSGGSSKTYNALGLPINPATEETLQQIVTNTSGGSGSGAILDGANATIKATVLDLTSANPLTVGIVDGNGDQITSFGGGTQYTEGDIDASITGTAMLFEGTSNTLRVPSDSYPLPVDITQGVDVQFGPGTIDEFGHLITGTINNQVDIQFYRDTVANLTTVTTANGGSASATNGMATFSATTTASSQAKGVSPTTTTYTAGGEIYCLFTAGWTGTGAGTSYQRIGLYDGTNGFFIGREGASFGVSVEKGGSIVSTPQASFSEDTLTGAAGSLFTRNGTPEAVTLTNLNVWRIRFGWVGSAPINFEILAPDGHWVTFHKIKQPNNAALPHINTADLPVTCDVFSGNSGNALTIITNCWAAGTTQALSKINSTITTGTLAGLTRAVITGETTAGGGGFVNVKVNPSGSLTTASTLQANNGVDVGDVTINNAAGASAVNIQDGGNSITVDGTVTASAQPGVDIGDVTINNSTGAAAVNIQDGGNSITVDGSVTVSATDLDIRNLAKAQDEIYTVLRTDAGSAYDARVLTSVPSHDVTNAGTFAVQNTEQGTASIGSSSQNVTTAGTRVQLGSQACKWLTIQAKDTNTDGVIIGGSAVLYSSRNGYVLFPSQSVTLKISNLNLIYVDSSVSGEGIGYIYGN
jgi:hypothetical protein